MAIQEINVLTDDGLRKYTEVLVAWIKSKLAIKNEENIRLDITTESNQIKISLIIGEITYSLVTIPLVDNNNAGLISPTMKSQIDSLLQGGEGGYAIQDLVDGTNILPTAMELGYIYIKDGKIYIPVTAPNGNYYNVIEIGKDGIKNITNTTTSDVYIPTLLNPTPSECEDKAYEMGYTRGFIFYDAFNMAMSIYDANYNILTRYGSNGVSRYEVGEDLAREGETTWVYIIEEDNIDDTLDEESENPVQNKVVAQKFNEYYGRFEDIDNDIISINNNISYLQGNINNIDQKVNNINTSSLQTQITDISGQVNDLYEQVSDNSGEIVGIKEDIENIENAITNINIDKDALKGIGIPIDEMADSGYYFNFNERKLIKTDTNEEITSGCYLLVLVSESKYYIFNADESELIEIPSASTVNTKLAELEITKADVKAVEANFGRIIPVKFIGDPDNQILPIMYSGDYYFDTTRNVLIQKGNPKDRTIVGGSYILSKSGNYFLYNPEYDLARIITNQDDIVDPNLIVNPLDFEEWKGGIITVKYWDEDENGVPIGILFAPGHPRSGGPEVGDYMYNSTDNTLQVYSSDEGWRYIDNQKHIICDSNTDICYIWTPGEGEVLERLSRFPVEDIYITENGGDPTLLPIYQDSEGRNFVTINLTSGGSSSAQVVSDGKLIYPAWNPQQFDPQTNSGDPGDYVFISENSTNTLYKYTTQWDEISDGNYLLINFQEVDSNTVTLLYLFTANSNDGNTLTRLANLSDIGIASGGGISEIKKNDGTPLSVTLGSVTLPDFVENSTLNDYYKKSEINTKLNSYALAKNIKNSGKAVYVTQKTGNLTIQSGSLEWSSTTTSDYTLTTTLVINNNKLLLQLDRLGVYNSSYPKYYQTWTATDTLLSSSEYTNNDLYYSINNDEISFWKRSNSGFTKVNEPDDISETLINLSSNVTDLLLNSNSQVKVVDPVNSNVTLSGDNDLGKYQLTFDESKPILKQYIKQSGTNTLVEVPSQKLYIVFYNTNLYWFRRVSAEMTYWVKIINESDLTNTNNKKIFKVLHSGTTSQASIINYTLGDVWYYPTSNTIKVKIGLGNSSSDWEDYIVPEHDSVLLYFTETNELKLYKDGQLTVISTVSTPESWEEIPNTVKKIVVCEHWGTDPGGSGTEGYWWDSQYNKLKIYNSTSEQWEETTETQQLLSENNLFINTLFNDIYRYKNTQMIKLSVRSGNNEGEQSEGITDAELNEILANLAETLSIQALRLNQLSIDTNELNSDNIIQTIKRLNGYVFGYSKVLYKSNIPSYGQIGDFIKIHSTSGDNIYECTDSAKNPIISIRCNNLSTSTSGTFENIVIPLYTKNNGESGDGLVVIDGITMKKMNTEEEMANYLCDQLVQKGYRRLYWSQERLNNNDELSKYPKSVCVVKHYNKPYYYVKIVPEYFGSLVNEVNNAYFSGNWDSTTGSAMSKYIADSGNTLIYVGTGNYNFNSVKGKSATWVNANDENMQNGPCVETLPDVGIVGQNLYWNKYNIPVWFSGGLENTWRDALGYPVSNDEPYIYAWDKFKAK